MERLTSFLLTLKKYRGRLAVVTPFFFILDTSLRVCGIAGILGSSEPELCARPFSEWYRPFVIVAPTIRVYGLITRQDSHLVMRDC